MKNPEFVEFISANGNLYLFLYTLQIKESILCELISGLFGSRCLWSSGHASDSSDADTRPATETISVSVGSGPKIDIESEDRSRTQLGEDGVSVKWASDD